ncbi:acyl-homoserine-lactone synthase TraI [Agrobacterium rhizogenes]|uniref:acyl-homoserine-lactone synthase n=1 Tax=Rhizobium rhizogenes TaxID=359 RepID=UPI0022B61C39|nr:acyl-homoserine-lactone synthase TraI [Rhizobium rhizogenes]MCZ7450235.1 acyl-homoserine-lactone synthase TraI [Rhizobium rhizogenes]
MRIVAVRNPRTKTEQHLILEMYRLRAKVFRDRLGWNVNCTSDMERDQFDERRPTYILCLGSSSTVVGCARLLPAMGGTMLQEVFPQLLHQHQLATHGRMVESSRFCVDTENTADREHGGLHPATLAMFAGIVQWCILSGYNEIVTATDLRIERILRRAGWPLSRLGEPSMINETRSIAGFLPADWQSFDLIRPTTYSSDFSNAQEEAA